MKHALKIFLVLVAVAAWAINGSTPPVEGVDFPVDRHTADTVSTKDAKDGVLFPAENLKGRSAKDFLMPDGRFDLKAIRASGYQGPLDLKGLGVEIDPRTGEPVLLPTANARISGDPDDTFWTDKFSCLAGLDGYCCALCVYEGKLIAGGSFYIANCALAANIASWDGSSWFPLGSGMGVGEYSPYVYALAVYDNKLIAGGYFTTAGGMSANYIASWDGSSWSPLGSGMDYTVYALAVYDNKLIAGGGFTTAGGVSANFIASWDGSSWSPLGSGMGSYLYYPLVSALAVYNSKLIAGGAFTTAGGVSANSIASWDGSSWSPLGSGMGGVDEPYVSALAVYDNKLIAGGGFSTAGGREC